MFQIDPLGFIDLIPQSLKQKARDTLVDFVAEQARKYAGEELATKLKKLRSDAAFNRTFEEGLQRVARRFFDEYRLEDEDLVAAIAADDGFFRDEKIQQALLAILKRPGAYLIEEQETLQQSFDSVLPQRINRERVDRAVIYLLKCLAEELWHLPELQPIYSLQFQRITAESTREQVAIQKAQLQALTGLNAGLREALLQLTDAIAEKKALPAGDSLALPAPSRPKVYHNLPQPDYGHFVGRDKELAQVARILRPYPHSQHALVTIDGIGGIGKSALALEIAHRYLRNYDRIPLEERFEAIIWTSAKQSVLTAEGIVSRRQVLRTLDDVYTAIAVALEREDITRAWPEEQAEVVRNALTRQRTLLIVDNLETVDDESVITFLRELPAPTKAIVTTRHRIDVAYPVRLVGMPWEDAQRLIAQESEKKAVSLTDAEARRLYDRTGGVPLAIVWSIAQMGFGHGVESALARLGQPTGDIARFCFEGAVELIRDKPAHRLLMALSQFPVDASQDALSYTTELPELDLDDGLVQLEKLSLINRQSGRFSLLPLTKQFAQSELKESGEIDLEGRWIDYYQKSVRAYGNEHWNWTNYDWLLAEGENILALIDWADRAGRGEISLAFTRAAMRYLDIEGRWTDMAKYGEELYELAQLKGDRRIWAWICIHWLSWIYAEQENLTRAETLAKEGLSLYRDLNDVKGQCLALTHVGRALRRGGNYGAAEKIYIETINMARAHNYGDGIAAVQGEWGKWARDQQKWEEGRSHFQAAIEWCEQHEEEADLDISFLMGEYGNLGLVEFYLGNYQTGKELIERSLVFFKRTGGRGYTTSLEWRLAIIENAMGNKAKAREHIKETIHWAKRLNMPRELREAQSLQQEMGT